MKTFNNFLVLSMLLCIVVAVTACSIEDGSDGMQGPSGTDGITGIDGVNGTDGINGTDGVNGKDGTDGINEQNGNANVRIFTYEFRDKSGTAITLEIPELTDTVLAYDVVLAYLKVNNVHYQVPNLMNPAGTTFFVRTFMQTGMLDLRFVKLADNSGYSLPRETFQQLKVVIIESTSITSGKIISTLDIMKKAGVNIENYKEVAAYFNLD